MDNLIDLKAIWLNVKTDSLPNSHEMMGLINAYKDKTLRKLVFIILAVFSMVFLMLFTDYVNDFALISTKVGEGLIILSGLLLIATNLNSLNRFYKLNACSNKEYIIFLEQTKVRQLFYFKYTQVIGTALGFVGLSLYMYELVYFNSLIMAISYLLLTVYFGVLFFYFRPKSFKKNSIKLTNQLENLRRIAKQF